MGHEITQKKCVDDLNHRADTGSILFHALSAFLPSLLYLALQQFLSSPAFTRLLPLSVQLLQPAPPLLLPPLHTQHLLHRGDLLQRQVRRKKIIVLYLSLMKNTLILNIL